MAMAEAATQTVLQGHNFSELFHTALRKGADSKESAVLWNLIHVLPDEVWNHFCNHVESRLAEAGAITAVSLRDACLSWNDFEIRKSRAHANLLRVALEMSYNDWPDLAAFMRDCIEGVSAERLTNTERVAVDSGFWSSDRLDLVPDNNAFHLSVRNREGLEVATISRRHFIHSCDSFFWLVDVPGYIPQSDRAMRAKTLDDALRHVMEILREGRLARRKGHSETPGADEKPAS